MRYDQGDSYGESDGVYVLDNFIDGLWYCNEKANKHYFTHGNDFAARVGDEGGFWGCPTDGSIGKGDV